MTVNTYLIRLSAALGCGKHTPQMGFEIFKVVMICIVVFQVTTPCTLVVGYQQIPSLCRVHIYPRDEGNILFQNLGTHLPDYMS